MALQYRAVMVEDNGPSRTQAQEEERKRKQAEQQAMAADPRANVQMTYSTPTKTATTPAAAKSPYEQRQAEIKAGVNKAQPISYAAPVKQDEEEEKPAPAKKKSGGVMADIPHSVRASADESQWFASQEEEEKPAATKAPKTAAEATAAVTETVQAPVITEPRRSGENRAEAQAPVVFTGGNTTRKGSAAGSASQTKAAMTEEEERRWYEENGLSWAAPTTGASIPKNGLNEAEQQRAIQRANAYAASKRAGYEADQNAVNNAAAYNASRARALEIAEGIGLFGQEAEEYADRLVASGVIAPKNVSQATQQQTIWDRINSGINASTARQQARTNQVLDAYGNRNAQGAATNQQASQEWANAYAAARRAGYDYTPPADQAAIDAANAYAASKRAGYDYTPPAAPKTVWDRINEGIAASTEQQAPRTEQILETYANRNTQGAQTDQQAAQQWSNAYAASKRAGYEYTPPTAAEQARQIPGANKTQQDFAEEYGIDRAVLDDPRFQKYYENLKAQGYSDQYAISQGYAYFESKRTDEKRQMVMDIESDMLDKQGIDYTELGTDEAKKIHQQAVEQAEEAFKDPTYTYSTPKRSGEDRAEANGPKGNTNNRPGAAAEVASWDQNQGWIQTNNKEGIVIDESTKPRPDKNGNTITNAAGNPVTTGSTQSTTQNSSDKSSNPKGTQYLTPSYGQGGKVVKLPYKSGGYTEAELMALGNKAYGTKYGANVYEGYYQAPDGNYYPVDQEKAAYYLRNGYSYEGWEEPMRDYYNTFGTFYGYRKDWKQAGKAGNNYSYSPRSYSYSAGGGSSRSSYGRGSTPNNGMYWNGLTSWNA